MQHTIEEYAKRYRMLGHVVRLAVVKALAGDAGSRLIQIEAHIKAAREVSAGRGTVRRAIRSLRDQGYLATERVDDYDLYRLTHEGRLVAELIGCKIKGS